jgi:N-acetylneuraminic acid mutarotase
MMTITRFPYRWIALPFVLGLGLLTLIGSGSSEESGNHFWSWQDGSTDTGQSGNYGTEDVAAGNNVPGARYDAASWRDASGNLWLFGGYGSDNATCCGSLNDLWMFDGSRWTWVDGSTTSDQPGTYGTLGVAAPGNVPGARYAAVSWRDTSGNLWLFGGRGFDSAGTVGDLNDLWRFNPTTGEWTWVHGSDTVNQSGTYGTEDVAAGGNVPGARSSAVSWIDSSGNFWLFGGAGYDSAGSSGRLNDLWMFNGTNWTWVDGSDTVNQSGTYGTEDVAAVGNVPGARVYSVGWIDGSNNLWLFGGTGYDSAGTFNRLNDLWMFDGTNWTWVDGRNTVNQSGTYGTKDVASGGNVPGARQRGVSWIDTTGNLWLFGGSGYGSTGTVGSLNDLWKFNGTNWTWVSGNDVVNQSGSYGTEDVADAGNYPGGRYGHVSWTHTNGDFWLFGGYGYDSTGTVSYLNDLWRFEP